MNYEREIRQKYGSNARIEFMIAIPEDELETLKARVKDLKGHLKDLELEKELLNIVNSYIFIYNLLSMQNTGCKH